MRNKTSHHKILNFVCNHYGVSSVAVLSKSRETEVLIPRKVYIYLLQDILKLTHEKIAFLVNRNTSSVTLSLLKTKGEIEVYKKLELEINTIKDKIMDSSLVVNYVDLLQMSINHTNSFV